MSKEILQELPDVLCKLCKEWSIATNINTKLQLLQSIRLCEVWWYWLFSEWDSGKQETTKCWKKIINLWGKQHVLSVTLVSAFHAFSLSTLKDVMFLWKNTITHAFSCKKSFEHIFSSVNMWTSELVFTNATSISTATDVNKWANHMILHLYVTANKILKQISSCQWILQ